MRECRAPVRALRTSEMQRKMPYDVQNKRGGGNERVNVRVREGEKWEDTKNEL